MPVRCHDHLYCNRIGPSKGEEYGITEVKEEQAQCGIRARTMGSTAHIGGGIVSWKVMADVAMWPGD